MSTPASTKESSTPAQSWLISIRSRSHKARIFLRSPIHSDSYSFTRRAHDPACTKFLPHISHPKTPITITTNENQIKIWREEALSGGGCFLAVVALPEFKSILTASDNSPVSEENGADPLDTIGDTGIGPLNSPDKTGETGIMLNSGPPFRGKGLAVEALDMVFAFGFEHAHLDRIALHTSKDNAAMQSLMEKRFGVPAVWREKQNDWEFIVGPGWWKARQDAKGEEKVVVDVIPEESA